MGAMDSGGAAVSSVQRRACGDRDCGARREKLESDHYSVAAASSAENLKGCGDMQSAATLDSECETAEAEAKRLLIALRSLVQRSWKTLMGMPDCDAKYLNQKSGWVFSVVHDAREAYGYSPARVRTFTPSAQDISNMEVVMTWMAWLRRKEGNLAIQRIMSWSLGLPLWQISQRERCSERTVLNRIDRSLTAILAKFLAADLDLEIVEEPLAAPVTSFCEERPVMGESASIEPGKVWIAGIGWMFRGKPWDNGEAVMNKKNRRRY